MINATYPSTDDLFAVWGFLISAPYRDETQGEIGQRVLGRRGKYAGPACMTTRLRYGLATKDINPDDRRKRFYRGRGDFDAVNWQPYEAEAAETRRRFDLLCELVRLPNHEIPVAIDRYFGDAVA